MPPASTIAASYASQCFAMSGARPFGMWARQWAIFTREKKCSRMKWA